jgi:hypothetical protein
VVVRDRRSARIGLHHHRPVARPAVRELRPQHRRRRRGRRSFVPDGSAGGAWHLARSFAGDRRGSRSPPRSSRSHPTFSCWPMTRGASASDVALCACPGSAAGGHGDRGPRRRCDSGLPLALAGHVHAVVLTVDAIHSKARQLEELGVLLSDLVRPSVAGADSPDPQALTQAPPAAPSSSEGATVAGGRPDEATARSMR